jgi:hypothetical protein
MSMTWEQTDSALAEFQRLCEKRDLAAYQAMGSINVAMELLRSARDEFDQADKRITEFLNSKKENTNGNHTTVA